MVEVVLKGGPRDDEAVETLRACGLHFRLLACRASDHGQRRLVRLFEVDGAPDGIGRAVRRLRARHGPHEVTTTSLGADRLLLRVATALPDLCSAAFEMGDICLSCPFLDGEVESQETTWSVLVPRIGDARRLLESVKRDTGRRPALVRAGAYRRSGGLTGRQAHALQVAFHLGYFDYPRKSSLSAVATRLGVGRSATLELLRKGITKLAAQRFVSDGSAELAP